MQEQEYWGELSASQFHKLLTELPKKNGQPKYAQRLSIKMVDPLNHQVDTRIKITNGIVEIVQKLGDWDNPIREENSFVLPADVTALLGIYQTVKNLLPEKRQLILIQHENYHFQLNQVELKLTRQFGQKDVYCFEVEGSDQQQLDEVCNDTGLKPMQEKRREILEQWNLEVNLDAGKLTVFELQELFEKYLKIDGNSKL
jgi:hypothetical protein